MSGSPRTPRRAAAAIAALLAASFALSGCTAVDALPRVIRTSVSDVSPYEPGNSVEYSSAVLRAKRPFARWEEDRQDIEVVTWPASCSRVPVMLSFVAEASTVQVGLGRPPRSEGPRQCRAGHVLTSRFLASRLLRRDRTTTLQLAGRPVLLPPAPALRTQRVSREVEDFGRSHPLRQVDGPLPQYSVHAYPWQLANAVGPGSRVVELSWMGGSCQQNASIAYVAESSTTVTIDVAVEPPAVDPQPDRSGGQWCAGVGLELRANVRLHRPLGDRRVLQHVFAPRPAGQNAF